MQISRLLVVCLWLGAALGTTHAAEPIRLIDSPTAGLVAKGRFAVDLRLFPEGGVLGQLHAGVLPRLTIGLSFGGERLIGSEAVDWYPRIEPAVRYRLIEENAALPALLLGYESQGYDAYAGGRFRNKSKGFFVAASKNYLSSLGQFGIHMGINLSREDSDGDADPSGWIGIDKSINAELSLVAEYDLALNDNGPRGQGAGNGYLNLGVWWTPVPGLSLGALYKDALENGLADPAASRQLAVRYTEAF